MGRAVGVACGIKNLDWIAGSGRIDWLSSLPEYRDPDRLSRVKSILVTGGIEP
jgi:hypothetical protein